VQRASEVTATEIVQLASWSIIERNEGQQAEVRCPAGSADPHAADKTRRNKNRAKEGPAGDRTKA